MNRRINDLLVAAVLLVSGASVSLAADPSAAYFPPPESAGGWRKLDQTADIEKAGGMDVGKLAELREWLLRSDDRDFAAVVIRNGYIVWEVERGNSAWHIRLTSH